MPRNLLRTIGLAAAVTAIFVAGFLAAGPMTGNTLAFGLMDDDAPLEGETLEKAISAALAHTNGGTVTDSEVGDDGSTYSVEIRLASGEQVEVNLDSSFNVIGTEADDDSDDLGDDDD